MCVRVYEIFQPDGFVTLSQKKKKKKKTHQTNYNMFETRIQIQHIKLEVTLHTIINYIVTEF